MDVTPASTTSLMPWPYRTQHVFGGNHFSPILWSRCYKSDCPKPLSSSNGQIIQGRLANLPSPLDYSDCFRDGYVTQAMLIRVCPGILFTQLAS